VSYPLVRPSLRSTTHARIKIRTPGGRVAVHLRKRKKGLPVCSICGKPLRGVWRGSSVELRKGSRSSKRPNRTFGGTICHTCLSNLIKMEARRISLAAETRTL